MPALSPLLSALYRLAHALAHPLALLALACGVGASLAPVPALAQATPAAAAARAKAVDEYRIGPGDAIRITVYQNADLSLETRVTEAGVISFPLVGAVQVGGLTVGQAQDAIANALRSGQLIKDPHVNIVVVNVRANQVNVLGQVAKPGRIPLDVANMRLTEVLAMAGGVVAGAGSDTIVVLGQRGGQPWRQEVELPRLFAQGGAALDIVLAPGDSIWVDRAPMIYVYGEVQKPGIQRLERGMTVMQALAASGGVTQRGTTKGLRVTRHDPDGQVHTYEPAMEDKLEDGDVMYLKESLF